MTHKEKKKLEYENQSFSGNNNEEFIVLNYFDSRTVNIQFANTKNKKIVTARNIDTGAVRDTQKIHDEWYKTIFKNNRGNEFRIVAYNNKYDVDIKFLETGTLTNVSKKNIDTGNIKDVYAVSVFGVGKYGQPNIQLQYYKKAYSAWVHMLGRCYDSKNLRYEQDKEVVERWKCFEYFLDDLPEVIGFQQWNQEDNIHLDKDMLGNSKIYGIDTCIFLTSQENSIERSSRRNKKRID